MLDFTLEGPIRILLRNDSTHRTIMLDSPGSLLRRRPERERRLPRAQRLVPGTGPGAVPRDRRRRNLRRPPLHALAGHVARERDRPVRAPRAFAAGRRAAHDAGAVAGSPRTRSAGSRYAHLIPVLGGLVRHDHVHLDVIVDGRKVTVPAGIGLAEPVDDGPCKPPTPAVSECSAGDYFTAFVANSPLHTHSASGIIHIEADRPGRYTLGQFFDEWGVRLTQTCLGGYCAGRGKELAVFVDGRRANGALRAVVLGNRQEIAVVFGDRRDFRSVPSTYRGIWPGLGCGGPGEIRC